MTINEAIQYLEPIADSSSLPRYTEALNTAIAAMKYQKERIAEVGKTIDHVAKVGKKVDHIREVTKKVDGCEYCSDFYREPELKAINLYKGPNYYVMDIERPEGFIPEPWRNKRLYVNFCPLCGRRLKEA